jgi:hypothetical protein
MPKHGLLYDDGSIATEIEGHVMTEFTKKRFFSLPFLVFLGGVADGKTEALPVQQGGLFRFES